MTTLVDKTILVTGATSGIGRAFAEALHARGNRVIVAGRRQALLDEITAAHPGMRGVRFDGEDPESIEALAREVPELDVLFANAGISRSEDLRAFDLSLARSILQTNALGVIQLTAALLPALLRSPAATILATGSALAFLPLASHPTYCASKAFLHSWLQSLRSQLRETSIEVVELVVPYVQTELTGARQLTDPNAMPLEDFIAEAMRLLDGPRSDEIVVERARALRWAEKDGDYARIFAMRNG